MSCIRNIKDFLTTNLDLEHTNLIIYRVLLVNFNKHLTNVLNTNNRIDQTQYDNIVEFIEFIEIMKTLDINDQ